MRKKFIGILIGLLIFIFKLNCVFAIEDIDFSIKKNSNSLEVNAKIIPSKEFVEDFKSGMGKDIQILIELYRRWSIIPDEFIVGKKIQRTLIPDPIKEEYIVKNLEGQIFKEKRFKNSMDALVWGLNIESVEFDNIKIFDPGKYYIKVTVESNIKKLPLILEHFLFFIPKYEIKKVKESERFNLP